MYNRMKMQIRKIKSFWDNKMKERAQFTNSGQKIEDKFEPSVDGLADCKYTSRDCTTMITLYAPHRHGITMHNKIPIARYGEHYRSLKIVLNRNGEADFHLPLYFDVTKGELREI